MLHHCLVLNLPEQIDPYSDAGFCLTLCYTLLVPGQIAGLIRGIKIPGKIKTSTTLL